MKKILKCFVSLTLIFLLSACGNVAETVNSGKNNSSSGTSVNMQSSDTSSYVSSVNISTSSEKASTTSATLSSSKVVPSSSKRVAQSSKTVSASSKTNAQSSKVNTSLPQTAVSSENNVTYNVNDGFNFNVTDPNNTRGLSNKKVGHSHGYETSKNNQNMFDSLSGVKALTLDTKTGKNNVYLTFDCGYEYNNLTLNILDTLKAKNVKAAFFCTLSYIKQNPAIVKRMISEGHIVGNHTATHPEMPSLSRTKMAEEIYRVHKYLQDNFGYTPKYFRFPAGSYSVNSLELVTSVGYKSIFWSFAYRDWETANQPNPATALETVKKGFYPGSVLLLHAVSKTNATLLPQIIDYGVASGYNFASLDEYFN